jgi:hypothetical protein
MAYTPELSQRGSANLRRLAWFRGKPMTETLEALLEATVKTMAEIRSGEVCAKCKDDSICEECPFHTPAGKIPPTQTHGASDGPDLSVRNRVLEAIFKGERNPR